MSDSPATEAEISYMIHVETERLYRAARPSHPGWPSQVLTPGGWRDYNPFGPLERGNPLLKMMGVSESAARERARALGLPDDW